jgi:NADH-quinone oxidoreductase subunit E/NADP-reducing hydrogenase subunit HndA
VSNENKCCCGCSQEDPRLAELKDFIASHKDTKGALIPVMHKVQTLYGFLPEDVLLIVSDELKVPMTEIYGVASFYSFFSLVPKGEHIIRVCLGTACYVKGSQLIIDEISKELNIEVGQTTTDGKFTLEACRCLGACGLAPAMIIGEKVYGRLTPEKVAGILAEY